MTAQMMDRVIYDGHNFRLIGHQGSDLPIPQTFDLMPAMWHTACYRGFVATYAVAGNDLVLDGLHIGRLAAGEWKAINTIEPEIVYSEGYSVKDGEQIPKRWENGYRYTNLNEPTYFSGGLLVAREFINSLYVHMGFAKPYQFEAVIELLFHEGTLTEVIDHSEKAKEWREAVIKQGEDRKRRWQALQDEGLSNTEILQRLDEESDNSDIMKGITWRFSLDYGKWF